MTDLSAERIARNEAIFRDANEHIGRAARRHEVFEGVPFLCECADERCTAVVRLSLDDYSRVRAEATHFVNAPGHEAPFRHAVEVVAERDGYIVVQKVGIAAEVAEELDTRSPDDG
jgi:hypothetical protein